MDRRNSVVFLETDQGKQTGYQEESAGNEYLRDENKRLHQENEQLREVFRVATIEFEKRDMKIASLGEQLEIARMRIRRLEEENAFLRAELEGVILRPGPAS